MRGPIAVDAPAPAGWFPPLDDTFAALSGDARAAVLGACGWEPEPEPAG